MIMGLLKSLVLQMEAKNTGTESSSGTTITDEPEYNSNANEDRGLIKETS